MHRNDKIESKIDIAKPHTIKKFELIEEYVSAWAHKLLQYEGCNGIVFIDCMCNRGIYKNISGDDVFGTPVRVAKLLARTMLSYPHKTSNLYFNDLEFEKVETLKELLPPNSMNFSIHTSVMDGNDFLKDFVINSKHPYLLIYDPYQAKIDWSAITPFLNEWGEVIINHMVSDTIRGIPKATKPDVKFKYEDTYQSDIDELVAIGNDRNAYEQKIKEIITKKTLPGHKLYLASFPFFNRTNGQVYSLLHCTSNINGFKLFKTTAWKTFDGKSSAKNTHGIENQLMINIDGGFETMTATDESCYNISDIARYLCSLFKGQKGVSLEAVFSALDEHPIFPSDGFRNEIKKELKTYCGASISKSNVSFP